MALPRSDVHFPVAKQFIQAVKEKVMGQECAFPTQQVVRIVRDEMVKMLDWHQARLRPRTSPQRVSDRGPAGYGQAFEEPPFAPAGFGGRVSSAARHQLRVLARDLKLPISKGPPDENKPAELTRGARKEAVQTGRDQLHTTEILFRTQ